MGLFRWLFGLGSSRRPSASYRPPSGGFHWRRRPADRPRKLAPGYDPLRLSALGLPQCQLPDDLAAAMGITPQTLHWLASDSRFHRNHYVPRSIPKRAGGMRRIHAPKPQTKAAQKWILDNILSKMPVADPVRGFRKGHSILTNASDHVGHQMVFSADLVNFFPSITRGAVRGVFLWMGYGPEVAEVLSLLCTACTGGDGAFAAARSADQPGPIEPGLLASRPPPGGARP